MEMIFFVNAWSLAHVTRAIEISKELKSHGHNILIAGTGSYLYVAVEGGFKTKVIDGVSLEELQKTFDTGNIEHIVSYERMKKDLYANIQLCEEIRPQLILSDNRIISRTTGDILKIPVISIMNAHITNYQKYPFISWADNLNFLPSLIKDFINKIQTAIERRFMDINIFKGIKKLRKEYKLKSLYSFEHEEGHLTLLPDIDFFNPTINLARNIKYVGPITWKSKLAPSQFLEKRDKKIPLVYFALGSYSLKASEDLTQWLGELPYHFIISLGSTEEKHPQNIPHNIFIENLVNADEILPHCSAMICHGGNGTLYQGLTHGVPIVATSKHPEQAQGCKQIQRLKLGIHQIQGPNTDEGRIKITLALKEIITNNIYKENVRKISLLLKDEDGPKMAYNFIAAFLKEQGLDTDLSLDKKLMA